MAKRDPMKLPDDLEGNLRALLHTPPPPPDTPGSRKADPRPLAKPKEKKQRRRYAKPAGTGARDDVGPLLPAMKGRHGPVSSRKNSTRRRSTRTRYGAAARDADR